jgi:hypothetical protein
MSPAFHCLFGLFGCAVCLLLLSQTAQYLYKCTLVFALHLLYLSGFNQNCFCSTDLLTVLSKDCHENASLGAEVFQTDRHAEVSPARNVGDRSWKWVTAGERGRRVTKLDEEVAALDVQKQVWVVVGYLESDCSRDNVRSGVMMPLASAAVQGEGTEAWCSREGGGREGGVARSLTAWTLRTATLSQHATRSLSRCHISTSAISLEPDGVGVAPGEGPGYNDRILNSATLPSTLKDGKLRASVCTQHWSSASHTLRTCEHALMGGLWCSC